MSEDRLRVGCDPRPRPPIASNSRRQARDDGGGARIAARPPSRARDPPRLMGISAPRPCRSAQRQRQSGKCPPPPIHNASLCGHAHLSPNRYPCYRTIAGRNRSVKQGFQRPCCHSGMVRRTRPGNLEISGFALDARPGNDGKFANAHAQEAFMSKSLIDLLAILDLESIEVNMFPRQTARKTSWQRVFGGPGDRAGDGGRACPPPSKDACRTHCIAISSCPAIPQISDHLPGRAAARRQELFDPARHRDPARQRDLLHHGVVSRGGAGARSITRKKMPDVPPPEKLTAEEVAKQPMFP